MARTTAHVRHHQSGSRQARRDDDRRGQAPNVNRTDARARMLPRDIGLEFCIGIDSRSGYLWVFYSENYLTCLGQTHGVCWWYSVPKKNLASSQSAQAGLLLVVNGNGCCQELTPKMMTRTRPCSPSGRGRARMEKRTIRRHRTSEVPLCSVLNQFSCSVVPFYAGRFAARIRECGLDNVLVRNGRHLRLNGGLNGSGLTNL